MVTVSLANVISHVSQDTRHKTRNTKKESAKKRGLLTYAPFYHDYLTPHLSLLVMLEKIALLEKL